MRWEIVTTSEQFLEIVSQWSGRIACDTETVDKDIGTHLLGISLAPEQTTKLDAVYIPCVQFETGSFASQISFIECIGEWLSKQQLIGHNFTYDKGWLKRTLGIKTMWVADTRLMWHLSAAPAGPRPYGLKDAQVELLGWEEKGDKELEAAVKARGGSLKLGDHYLAPLEILAKYAALDAYSTMQVYKKLKPFFDRHEYW